MIGRAFLRCLRTVFRSAGQAKKGDMRQKIPLIFNAIKIESLSYAVADSGGSVVKQGSRLFDGGRQETFKARAGYARPSRETGSATGTCPGPSQKIARPDAAPLST
jgi:hypothetical protein